MIPSLLSWRSVTISTRCIRAHRHVIPASSQVVTGAMSTFPAGAPTPGGIPLWYTEEELEEQFVRGASASPSAGWRG